MNHQLRTPLNAIIGYSEILLEEIEPNTNSADEADLRTINTAGRHLLSLLSTCCTCPRSNRTTSKYRLRPSISITVSMKSSTCRNLVSQNGNEFILERSGKLGIIQNR